jgi:metal-responsive CopG/Arc/MetJ family transcriptional regulator
MSEAIVHERQRTTIDLSRKLLERSTRAVRRGAARSRNALMEAALAEYLDRLERAWIDEEFAAMAQDERYRELNLQIAEEFAQSDWEAWQIGEGLHATR